MKPSARVALVSTCAAVWLAGCQMNVITQIDASGAGTLTTEVGMTPDEVAQLQSLGGETGGSACSAFSSGEVGAADAPEFEEETRGEETWCVAATPFDDLDELEARYEDMGFVRVRELTLIEGILVYDLEVDTQGSDEAMPPAGIRWILELPGKVGSHNAESLEGKRLTWTLGSGEMTEVKATSDVLGWNLPFGLGGTEGLIVAGVACACCGGVLLLVVALVVVLLVSRKRSEPAQGGDGG